MPSNIRLARPSDAQHIPALASVALNGATPHHTGKGDLVHAITKHGGCFPVLHGRATAGWEDTDDRPHAPCTTHRRRTGSDRRP